MIVTTKRYDLSSLVMRYIGEKILLIDIKQNAIYEVDESTASCVSKIKANNGIVDYPSLSCYLEKDIEILKQEVPEMLKILIGEQNE